MNRIFLALSFALCAVAAPAHAADVAQLSCVNDAMTPDLRSKLAADTTTHMLTKNTPPDDVLYKQLAGVVQTCGDKFGWSDDAKNAAFVGALASVALPATEAFARARGIDLDKVWKLWRGLPEKFRSSELSNDDLDELGQTLDKAKLLRNNDDATVLGKMLYFANAVETNRKKFAAA